MSLDLCGIVLAAIYALGQALLVWHWLRSKEGSW